MKTAHAHHTWHYGRLCTPVDKWEGFEIGNYGTLNSNICGTAIGNPKSLRFHGKLPKSAQSAMVQT